MLYQSKQLSHERWENILEEAKRERIWEKIPPEKPYGSLDAMLQAEIGVGEVEARAAVQAKAMLTGTLAKPEIGRGKAGPGRGKKKTRNGVTRFRGNAADYQLARLRRDAPDVFRQAKDGKFSSVAEAMRAAGLAPKDRRMWLSEDPAEAAAAIETRFGAEYARPLGRSLTRLLCRRQVHEPETPGRRQS
jgi:hypothetical protein